VAERTGIVGTNHAIRDDAETHRAKKTAALVAPPKFREETSKKAVRRSASARRRMVFAIAACKRYFAATQHFVNKADFCGKTAT
jgi:hypothetical protein